MTGGEVVYVAALADGPSTNWQGAKSYCENYDDGTYDDWFLPDRIQLNLMWENLHRFGCSNTGRDSSSPCPTALGGFAANHYWSRVEGANIPEFLPLEDHQMTAAKYNAWLQNFFDGSQGSTTKDQNILVRPMRVIHR